MIVRITGFWAWSLSAVSLHFNHVGLVIPVLASMAVAYGAEELPSENVAPDSQQEQSPQDEGQEASDVDDYLKDVDDDTADVDVDATVNVLTGAIIDGEFVTLCSNNEITGTIDASSNATKRTGWSNSACR